MNDELTRTGELDVDPPPQHASADDAAPRERSIELLEKTLAMLCHFIWHRTTRPGDHMWSIPVDKERDFDCILSDAIDELQVRRSEAAKLRVIADNWKLAKGGMAALKELARQANEIITLRDELVGVRLLRCQWQARAEAAEAKLESATPDPARLTDSDEGRAIGSAIDRLSSKVKP